MLEVLGLEDVDITLSDLQVSEESVIDEHVVKICEPEIDITDLLNISVSAGYAILILTLKS